MPIRPPALDDRGYEDLVAELLARVPAHTPEWTNPRPGDPGRTMVELFAWLADTILYRANLVPERQRLAFLRLVGVPMRPAQAARGLVVLSDPRAKDAPVAVPLRALATLKGPVPFETRQEITVLPVEGAAYHKRALSETEQEEMAPLVDALRDLYGLAEDEHPVAYVTTPVFAAGAPDPAGFDLVRQTVDQSLWIALLAPGEVKPADVRKILGASQVLNVGVAPAVEVPGVDERIGRTAGTPVVWEISTPRWAGDEPEYLALDVLDDGTGELTRRGVVRLALPGEDDIGAPANDAGLDPDAGSRARPPRLDNPAESARLVAWLRLRPAEALESLPVSWVGINAVEIDQRQTVTGRVVGESDGSPDQAVQLPGTSIERETFVLEVEDPERGYVPWARVEDLATAGRDDAVYQLDEEAGTVRFGDGMRGMVPRTGMRVRVARMRAGGGEGGNLPAGTLTKVSGYGHDGAPMTRLAVHQPLATEGGDAAETLAEAERRIPQLFRHRNRAVTPDDYRHLAASAPGVRAGRVEVLPRFKPQQRRDDVPGVVSVMVLPRKELRQAPNPRPDRPFLERVHAHLDAVRPVTTELYVIGAEYVPLGLATSIGIAEGAGRDATIYAVREALRAYLWPLAPGGPAGEGWPLARGVSDRELEVVIARVPGVGTVQGVNLFRRQDDVWRMIARPEANAEARLVMEKWQLPELLSVVVLADGATVPTELRGVPDPFAGRAGAGTGSGGRPRKAVAVPVVPELC
ncbi:putative baseplate assembly protein [Longimicrobium sp.]|uniref:putative baseplate assembly protein n=1 Tax=Longimicrobium sp. TaxID=2029185 RepID=UPI002E3347B7|nr:putative baseplate assembly protein [Longimicrobium sp.]HEX6036939.1 putative baseplate assembly protein [Longimicrobium sp.]